jgi:hypothetical protein
VNPHPTRRELDAMGGPATAVPAPEVCAARPNDKPCERPATLGLLCGQDGTRIADHYGAREGHGQPGRLIHGLPWMYEHVRLAYPSVTGWTAGNGASDIDDPEAEKLAAVLALRTDILDHLTETARDLAERLGRAGPQLTNPRWRVTPFAQVMRSAGWLLVNIESLRAGQGVQATAEYVAAAKRQAQISWLLSDDPTFSGAVIDAAAAAAHISVKAEAVAAVLEEADDLASRAHALAPWRPAPTKLKDIPCRCGSVGTIYDHSDVRKCWRCGRTYSEEEWAIFMKVYTRRFCQRVPVCAWHCGVCTQASRDQEGATA